MTISFANLRPDDGNALQRATRRAERMMVEYAISGRATVAGTPATPMTPRDRERLAEAVVWIARSGYGRKPDGALDEEALSQAAVARLRSFSGRR